MSELKLVYHRSILFKKAWAAAKHRARLQACPPRVLLPQALRESWAEQKKIARGIAEQRARVLACVAEIRAERAPLAVARRQKQTAALDAEIKAALARANAGLAALRQRAARRAA